MTARDDDNLPDRRQPNVDLERRIDQVDSKVDRVGDRVEAVGNEMRSTLEMLMKQQDDHWKWFEQRSDMDSRNQKQAIELLTSSMVKVQQDVGSVETQVDMLERDQQVAATKLEGQKANADLVHDELLRRIEQITENLKWVTRTLVASLLTIGGGLVLFFVTHP